MPSKILIRKTLSMTLCILHIIKFLSLLVNQIPTKYMVNEFSLESPKLRKKLVLHLKNKNF